MKPCDNPACNRKVRNEIGYCCGTCASMAFRLRNSGLSSTDRIASIHDDNCLGRPSKRESTSDRGFFAEEFYLSYSLVTNLEVTFDTTTGKLYVIYDFPKPSDV